jgi:L-alanine-DL-glutamate epimerase-like enolase superfamily enzyme
MIIAGIEAIPLRIPFKAGTKSDASAWGDSNLPTADSLLVKVTTDQGLVGWGEAFGFRAVASAKLAVDQLIEPLCIGQDRNADRAADAGGPEEAARLWAGRRPCLCRLGD